MAGPGRPVHDRPPPLPARPLDGHKGTFGTVIIIGGCPTMPGAPALCARAALRGGAGLARIAASREVLALSLVIEPHATGIELPDSPDTGWLDAADPNGRAVLAVGPGMGTSARARATLERVLPDARPMVLDADGLNLLCELGPDRIATRTSPSCGERILTPHPGEFARLARALGLEPPESTSRARYEAAATLARRLDAVIVLKGANTIIADGNESWVNPTGGPVLGVGGSGDVLTGLIAALMAQGLTGRDAARLGAWMHGAAGQLWRIHHGAAGLLASELADLLPRIADGLPRRVR